MDDLCKELQQVLYDEIPLSRALAVEVDDYDHTGLLLSAPLQPNINHKCTVFGGSLYSVAVLSGWGLLYLLMKERGLHGHIVIYHSEIDYHRPVAADFYAEAAMPDKQQLQRFFTIYQKRGMSRLEISSRVMDGDELAVSFRGQYVVHK